MTALGLATAAPAALVALAAAAVAVRERCGGCRARQRWAFVRAATLAPVEGE